MPDTHVPILPSPICPVPDAECDRSGATVNPSQPSTKLIFNAPECSAFVTKSPTAATMATREAASLARGLSEGHPLHWRRSALDRWRRVVGVVAIGAELVFALDHGDYAVCRWGSVPTYSLGWNLKLEDA